MKKETQFSSDKVVDNILHDKSVLENCKSRSMKLILVGISVSILYTIFLLAEKSNENLSTASFLWDIPLAFICTCCLFFSSLKNRREAVYSDGSRVKGCTLRRLVCYIVALVPIYSLCVIKLDLGVVSSLWMAPAGFFGALFLFYLYDSPEPYTKGPDMTVSDYRLLRDVQSRAGINPDKVPLSVLNSSEVKSMTVGDWIEVKRKMGLAGYHID